MNEPAESNCPGINIDSVSMTTFKERIVFIIVLLIPKFQFYYLHKGILTVLNFSVKYQRCVLDNVAFELGFKIPLKNIPNMNKPWGIVIYFITSLKYYFLYMDEMRNVAVSGMFFRFDYQLTVCDLILCMSFY